MGKPQSELMISVEVVDGFPAGMRLFESDELVKHNQRSFVRFDEGDRAVHRRRAELMAERRAAQDEYARAARAAALAIGTRPLGSDDAISESAKRAVRENHDLELVHDDATGAVIGVRPKHPLEIPEGEWIGLRQLR